MTLSVEFTSKTKINMKVREWIPGHVVSNPEVKVNLHVVKLSAIYEIRYNIWEIATTNKRKSNAKHPIVGDFLIALLWWGSTCKKCIQPFKSTWLFKMEEDKCSITTASTPQNLITLAITSPELKNTNAKISLKKCALSN